MRALLFSLFLLAFSASAAQKADLNAQTLTGQKVHLKDLRGKLLVVNFWATWCVPCREEMPLLISAARHNTDPALQFLAISVDDAATRPKIPAFVEKYGIPFPVWTGATGDDLFKLSKGEAVPATLFIDRDGTVLSSVSGQIREPELQQRLAWLLSDRQGPKPPAFTSHAQ